MSKQPIKPQRYSVDEMMNRLRDGEREKEEKSASELVVRADGTQVIRVRKRKRRSQQEQASSLDKGRNPLIYLLGLAALLVVILGVAIVVLLARYNSSGFQTAMEETLTEANGGSAEFGGLSVTPLRVRSDSLTIQWGEGRALNSLSLSNLSARLSFGNFLGGSWGGVPVTAQSGELILGGTSTMGGGPRSDLEANLFEAYRCKFLDIHVGALGRGIQFKNAELAMRNGPEGETQLYLRGGDTVIPGWSVMKTDRGMAEFVDGGLKLVSLRLQPESEEGEISFTSESIWRDGEDIDLGMKVDGIPLSTFVGTDIGKLIDAEISCENAALSLDGGTLEDVALRMEFSGAGAGIQNFPFLEILKTRLTDSEFAKPLFKSVQGLLVQDRNGVWIQELELMEKSQMAVRGQMAVNKSGALSGRLEVGVVAGKIITPTKRKRLRVFSDPVNGFCWVTINLSGTVEEPMDDFLELLREAAQEESPRNREKILEDRLEDLTR